MNVVLSNWAWLEKSTISEKALRQISAQLTLYPQKFGSYPGSEDEADPVRLYVDRSEWLGVPREFYPTIAGAADTVDARLSLGAPIPPLHFRGKLRSEQGSALRKFVSELHGDRTGGIMQALPGWGKTVWSCALIAALAVPALVIVHKNFLADQWSQRLKTFLPGVSIGRIQQGTWDWRGRQVVVAMVHTLVSPGIRIHSELRDYFGLVLGDEIHRVAAQTWWPAPGLFTARYRVGVTATPRRKDGLEDIFYWQIGPVLFRSTEQRLVPKIRRVYTDFRVIKTETVNAALASRPTVMRLLAASPARNRTIAEQLKLAVAAGRKVLVLSELIAHLENIYKACEGVWGSEALPSFGVYIGGRTREELAKAEKAQVILATKQLVSEGLDIPALDTLFLTTPISDVEQAVGRILRPCEGKKEPIVVDFIDRSVGFCKTSSEYREAYYNTLIKPDIPATHC